MPTAAGKGGEIAITWPIPKLSHSKKQLVSIANTYARNQRSLLGTLSAASAEVITIGNRALAEGARADNCFLQLGYMRSASLEVLASASRRRLLSRLIRVWHTWSLAQRERRLALYAEQSVMIVVVWSAWCRYHTQQKLEALRRQHRFLTAMQDRHVLQASRRTVERAMLLSTRRAPLRWAFRRWSVITIESHSDSWAAAPSMSARPSWGSGSTIAASPSEGAPGRAARLSDPSPSIPTRQSSAPSGVMMRGSGGGGGDSSGSNSFQHSPSSLTRHYRDDETF